MFKKLFKSVREYKKPSIYSIVFIILEVLVEVIIPYTMADLLDNGINAGNMDVVTKCGITLILYAVSSLIFGTLAGIFASKASCGFAKNLRQDMYYKVQDFSFNNIDKFSTSSIITRLTTDVTNVQGAYQMLIRITVRAPLMLIFSLFMAFKINKRISLIFLCLIPVLATVLLTIVKKAHPRFEKVFKTYDELNEGVQENVRGIRVVKSYVKEEYEKEKFSKISKLIYERFCSAERLISYNGPAMQLSMYTGIILISWFGSKMIVNSQLTAGELTSLITYGGSILGSLMMISMTIVFLTLAISSGERIVEILEEKSNLKSPDNPIKEMEDGSIIFDNVSFGYKDKLVLKNINLNIKSGETIGIIGSTGSSKSSLVSLISRLYDVQKGKVLVGNVDVRDYDLDYLRDNVSVVLQKNVLFSGTIKENLRWGNKTATDLEMQEACAAACADEFIEELKDKYDSHVDQGGNNFSGGQKQRLCIARALLKRQKVLILDDSTSAVDTATDSKIREAFKKYIPDVTKIIIAQRINSIEHADRIIVLNNGKVDAFDTPKNLLKNNKIYQEVYHAQVEGGK